jgi:IS30 family transposase
MAMYRRVTYEDRCQIRAFLQVKVPVRKISRGLGFHKSTIYREILRNRSRGKKYLAERANELAAERKTICRRPFLIRDELEGLVLTHLFSDWSPEQIAGRLAHERVAILSHQTIYNYVWRHKSNSSSLPTFSNL